METFMMVVSFIFGLVGQLLSIELPLFGFTFGDIMLGVMLLFIIFKLLARVASDHNGSSGSDSRRGE